MNLGIWGASVRNEKIRLGIAQSRNEQQTQFSILLLATSTAAADAERVNMSASPRGRRASRHNRRLESGMERG